MKPGDLLHKPEERANFYGPVKDCTPPGHWSNPAVGVSYAGQHSFSYGRENPRYQVPDELKTGTKTGTLLVLAVVPYSFASSAGEHHNMDKTKAAVTVWCGRTQKHLTCSLDLLTKLGWVPLW
jgi:hypothetical protein